MLSITHASLEDPLQRNAYVAVAKEAATERLRSYRLLCISSERFQDRLTWVTQRRQMQGLPNALKCPATSETPSSKKT
jgi:hypothetical protein